jgi:hypothetical protein
MGWCQLVVVYGFLRFRGDDGCYLAAQPFDLKVSLYSEAVYAQATGLEHSPPYLYAEFAR